MLINMCHPSLQPGIKCNKPSYDGYEVENLTKVTSMLGNNGFMVERFIKAPVNVTLQFPCNIHIFKICINPFVGSQKSLGFEIFTNSENVKHSWLIDSTSSTIPIDTDGCFVSIGRTLLTEARNICFRNYKFDCRELSVSEIPSVILCKQEIPLTHYQNRSLQNVSHVMVRITHTAGSSVPCIGKLEVWAKPAANVSKELKQKLYSCFMDSQTCKNESDSIALAENEPISKDGNIPETLNQEPITSADSVEVPEEFTDPLTCEIMSVPMLLPSGQSIDQSTLENFIDAEANWGRPPSNPFTGIKFDKSYKAIPNISLKVRIDKFLMEHSSHFPNVSRTVGRASDFHNQHIPVTASKWVKLSRDSVNQSVSAGNSQNSAQSSYQYTESVSQKNINANKDNKFTNSFNSKLNNFVNQVKPQVSSYSPPTLPSKRNLVSSTDQQLPNKKQCHKTCESSSNASSHENSVTQSLNNALSMALSNLPTFLSPQGKTSDKKEETNHSKCDNCTSTCISLYTLPCKHTMCSHCLKSLRCNTQATSQQYICSKCGKSFPAKDVCRLYT